MDINIKYLIVLALLTILGGSFECMSQQTADVFHDNSYWQMPFRKKCKITMENIDVKPTRLYYQIDYVLTDVPENAAYFHAQFRKPRPDRDKEAFTIIDGIKGKGQYVGTYMAWQDNNNGWWGEGEIKFFMGGGRYLRQESDIASVAYWYQTEPHNPFPELPSKDELEVR